MDPGAGKSHKLTVSAVANRLTFELESLGFVLTNAHPLRLAKSINDQSEVFVYPGVRKEGADIRIDPVIGVENTILRQRLLAIDKRWEGSTRVCHMYLGLKAGWNRFFVRTEQELDNAAYQIVRAVVEIGLPMMSAYDTLDKAKQLFRDDLDHSEGAAVAVLFPKDKLRLIETH
jgi:hypothetical protein